MADAVRPYARALYEVASAQGVEGRIGQDLALLRALWEGDPDFAQPFITHPLVHAAAKEGVLERALGGVVHPLTLNLLRILVRRGKAPLVPELAPAFYREQEEHGKALHVVARTARPLTPEARASLQSHLAEVLGKSVTVEDVVDPDLLAGVELVVSGRRLDTSLRGRLDELAAELKG